MANKEVHAGAFHGGCVEGCIEGDPSTLHASESYVYVGEAKGAYMQESQHVYVGAGRGAWEQEVRATYGGWRVRACCVGLMITSLLIGLCLLLLYLFSPVTPPANDIIPPAADAMVPDCNDGFYDWQYLWNVDKRAYCCDHFGRGCPPQVVHYPAPAPHVHYVQVPVPAPHYRQYNCHAGYSNWYFGWSRHKKGWCCAHARLGCPGTWHGSYHQNLHITHGVGHAHGRIYDCAAGWSNWMQGWSDSKKDWCCSHEKKGCVKYHCNGVASHWVADKRAWCCKNFQKGCPKTTLSSLKCDAPCTIHGTTSTCKERISWARHHKFSGQEHACNLAYSKVQVECDICRACSIQEAGCEVHGEASEPFDCMAALNNFFRAWSPEKKHWCCTIKGKGCEGHSPPAVDAGYGMVWKRVQVNGYWTWVAVHGEGHISLPYDCHAGLDNWHTGWSQGKKGWCCAHQHLGCDGGAGTTVVVHHVVHHGGAYYNHAHPPGAAGAGMVWSWSSTGGHGHWVQIHASGHLPFDCQAGFSNWRSGWSPAKKAWCCSHVGNSCA